MDASDPSGLRPASPDAETVAAVPGSGSPQIPDFIANFRIRRLIGAGGMGIVYEAEQAMPRRVVALKVIRPGFVTPDLRRRFEMEVQVLGRLHHPGIAHIFQAGITDTGAGLQPYFVMELVDGLPLLAYATQRALDARGRLRLVAAVCDAVQHAHQRGVIHRDLKPGNILVELASGQPKILDFGVARSADPDLQLTSHTQMGQLVGTLPYMSPEQLAANPNEVDTRSDVYALGVILYELLSGRLPHDVTHVSTLEAMVAIRDRDPQRVSTFDRRLRGDVETIVAKALEKEKERRYESSAELAADIRRYLDDQPIVARPSSGIYQLRKFARRNKALVAGLAGAFLILIAGVVASTWQAVRATRAERLAGVRLEETDAARAVAQRREMEAQDARRLADERRIEAEGNLRLAQEARGRAERQQEANRELLYVSDMNLAQRVRAEGDHPRLLDLLARHQSAPGLPDLRGFEWFHLWHAAHLHERAFELPGFVQAIDVTADGRAIAAAGADGSVRVWDVATGDTLLDVREPEPLSAIAISSNRQTIATGSRTGVIRVRDAVTGREVASFKPGDGRVATSGLRFASAGRVLMAVGTTTKIWDVATSRELFSHTGPAMALPAGENDEPRIFLLRGPNEVVIRSATTEHPLAVERFRDVTSSDDGTHIAILNVSGTVTLWDRAGTLVRTVRPERPLQPPMALSAGGRLLAARAQADSVVLDTATARAVATLPFPAGLRRFRFSPDGTLLILAGPEGVTLFDIARAAVRTVVQGHAGTAMDLVVTADGRRLITAGSDSVKVWNLSKISAVERPNGHTTSVSSVAVSADGRWLASAGPEPRPAGASARSKVILWDASSGRLVAAREFELNAAAVAVAGSRTVVVGDESGGLIWWSTVGDGAPATAAAHRQVIRALARTPDGTRVASAAGDEVKVWAAEGGPPLATLDHRTARAVAFSPDGARLATAGFDGLVRVWRLADRSAPRVLRGQGQGIWSVAWSPDDRLIASSDETGAVVVWDVASGRAVVRLRAHPNRATTVAFSPDSRRLLSGGLDGFVRLWDRNTWNEAAHFKEQATWINGAAFTSDGSAIVAATDRALLIWRAAGHPAVPR